MSLKRQAILLKTLRASSASSSSSLSSISSSCSSSSSSSCSSSASSSDFELFLISGENSSFLSKSKKNQNLLRNTVVCIIVRRLACLWSKMPMFQWAGMKKGVEPLPLAFQYLILMLWRPCDLNLAMISSLASKCQDFKFEMAIFQPFYEMKLKTAKFKVFAFWSHWRYHD